ncbi:polysaccharide deacetylase family protein [Nitrospiraceae bacterium AH_259_D15_M11_P09]|nr:polysaccharide deacetylase family protein [Nitrospiraceae bacterium AH_259_D15_M11_P09]
MAEQNWNQFEGQIKLLYHEYGFINPVQFETAISQDKVESLTGVLLSFDDGFVSSYRVAKEILSRYSIKAIFFLPTGFLDAEPVSNQKKYIARRIFRGRIDTADVPDDMCAMTWKDAEWLVGEGHTIGAHTVTHTALSQLYEEALNEEIVTAGDNIEQRLGISAEWFAFPFGSIDSVSSAAFRLIKKRYRYCCSSIRGRNKGGTYPYAIRRDPVDFNSPAQFVRFLVEGGMGHYYRKQAARLVKLAMVSEDG